MEKEIKKCLIPITLKEKDEEFYSDGFIATTHPDRASDSSLGVVGDVLSKGVMQQIADYINNTVATIKGIGSTRTVSLQHDWVKESNPDLKPAGMAMPPAEVKQTEDGHYGVYVKTHHNKTHPQYEDIIYQVKNKYLPGYSIEYEPGEYDIINLKGEPFRFLKSINNFVGYAFASARKIANPAAIITNCGYKEIETEVTQKMSEEEIKAKALKEAEEKAKKEAEEKQKIEDELKVEDELKLKELIDAQVKEKLEAELKAKEASKKDLKIDIKELVDNVTKSKEYQDALDAIKPASKALNTGIGEVEQMNIRIKELQDAISKDDLISAKEAGLQYMREESDFFVKAIEEPKHYTVGFKSNLNVKAVGKGIKIMGGLQVKGTLDSSVNTSDYSQAPVEFADVFAPGIIDTFNIQTNLWGFLEKENHIGGTHYQWKMIVDKDPDSNGTFVDFDDVTVKKNYSEKLNYQTPIKVARRGVSVADTTDRYSAASFVDLFQLELDLQMTELMKDSNKAVFTEVADGTGNSPLGLEAVADSAGNITLYGYTRSTANRLAPESAGNTYTSVSGALTEAAMRTKISYLETEGSVKGRIALVASPNSRDLLFNLLDGQRRFNTTEATFGFNRMMVPSYEGMPIIVDPDCNSDAIYFIDRDADKIIMAMEPRIVSLAKVGAATEAYLEMHFAHVYKQPRRVGMLDTLA